MRFPQWGAYRTPQTPSLEAYVTLLLTEREGEPTSKGMGGEGKKGGNDFVPPVKILCSGHLSVYRKWHAIWHVLVGANITEANIIGCYEMCHLLPRPRCLHHQAVLKRSARINHAPTLCSNKKHASPDS